jgi:hypothetical protein
VDTRVPPALIDRPKMGFAVPLARWFRGPLRAQMDSYVAGADLESLDLDPRPLRHLWTAFQNGRSHRSDLLWQMFMLAEWSRRCRTAAITAMREDSPRDRPPERRGPARHVVARSRAARACTTRLVYGLRAVRGWLEHPPLPPVSTTHIRGSAADQSARDPRAFAQLPGWCSARRQT